MISTSTIFHCTARVTVTGVLTVSFFKKTALDHAAKVVNKAEKVTIVTLGLAAADLCLSTAILILASDRTARKLLNGEFNQPKDNSPSLSSDNMPDTSTPPTSPRTDYTHYSPPLTGPTPVPRKKRFSMESDTTLVADEGGDDDNNPSDPKELFSNESEDGDLLHGTNLVTLRVDNPDPQSILVEERWTTTANSDLPLPAASTTIASLFLTGSILPQSISPPHKPPDTERILNRRRQQNRARLRAARARSYIGCLEQLHSEILVDQLALVDGWADAMAKLGLTSTLSPAPSLPNPTCTH